jgi:alpha,alpha-trehalase
MTPAPEYPPIESFGLIGNRHTCALVGLDGAIEWCCLPHLESPSVFASILDRARGGCWRIGPVAPAEVTRAYVRASSVLDTVSTTGRASCAYATSSRSDAGGPAREAGRSTP